MTTETPAWTRTPVLSGRAAEQLSGYVEHVTYHNSESGFSVLQVKIPNRSEPVVVVGCNASIAAGEQIEAEGTWVNNREYGIQFKAASIRTIPPSTVEGMEKYLGSGLIKGIGPHYAKRIMELFRENAFEVIENDPVSLLKIKGIGRSKLDKIIKSWSEQKMVRQIMVFLQSHGVGTTRAVRIYRTYGDDAIDIVRQNPYRLASDIKGIGFKTADELAQRLGIDPESMIRARAGVNHVLLELSSEGHATFPLSALVKESVKLLNIPSTTIEKAIEEERASGSLVSELGEEEEEPWIYLAYLHKAERELAENLLQLSQYPHPLPEIDVEKALDWVEAKTGFQLSFSQKDAVIMATKSKLLVITGGPGVGKTTLVNSILKIFEAKKLTPLLSAPTGRAAKRLSESTGLEAKTIHRLLDFDPQSGHFRRNRENPLECDVLVVDETSMVDLPLMNKLVQAIPKHAALIMVGDIYQLPSVGPGEVLAHIIESDSFPVIRLKEIFRQAAQSRIITNAHLINQGRMPILDNPAAVNEELTDFYFIEANEPEKIYEILIKVVTHRIPERFSFNPLNDVQVLTPMNKSGLGTRALNMELQKALNPTWSSGIERFGSRYSPGDKVMQLENNYEKEVFNGDIGIIKHLDGTDKELLVSFDGRDVVYEFDELDELSLAYAVTIHKSQGSEYPAVVMVLHTQHYQMLKRNLIYTGVTRGKKLVVLIGNKKALRIALNNQETGNRFSRLKERLLNSKPL